MFLLSQIINRRGANASLAFCKNVYHGYFKLFIGKRELQMSFRRQAGPYGPEGFSVIKCLVKLGDLEEAIKTQSEAINIAENIFSANSIQLKFVREII